MLLTLAAIFLLASPLATASHGDSCTGILALTLDPSAVSQGSQFVASVSGLSGCDWKSVRFGRLMENNAFVSEGYCVVSGAGCSATLTAPSTAGSYEYHARTNDGDRDTKTLTVSSPSATPVQAETLITLNYAIGSAYAEYSFNGNTYKLYYHTGSDAAGSYKKINMMCKPSSASIITPTVAETISIPSSLTESLTVCDTTKKLSEATQRIMVSRAEADKIVFKFITETSTSDECNNIFFQSADSVRAILDYDTNNDGNILASEAAVAEQDFLRGSISRDKSAAVAGFSIKGCAVPLVSCSSIDYTGISSYNTDSDSTRLSKSEAVTAVLAFFNGAISKEKAVDAVSAYYRRCPSQLTGQAVTQPVLVTPNLAEYIMTSYTGCNNVWGNDEYGCYQGNLWKCKADKWHLKVCANGCDLSRKQCNLAISAPAASASSNAGSASANPQTESAGTQGASAVPAGYVEYTRSPIVCTNTHSAGQKVCYQNYMWFCKSGGKWYYKECSGGCSAGALDCNA